MERIKKKIKSNNGASITFALLIFLVCVVVSAVVIVAATASAGRMAKTAEMDQRYYSVTSAVELLCYIFENEEVEVRKDEEGELQVESLIDPSKSVNNLIADVAKTIVGGSVTSPSFSDFEIKPDQAEDLAVNVSGTIRNDGTLIFTISKTVEEKTFALKATFTVNRQNVITGSAENSTLLSWKLSDVSKAAGSTE